MKQHGVESGWLERLLAKPVVYRTWQAPFVPKKLDPLRERLDLIEVGRVLDVGCGPGTNAFLFQGDSYVGVDLNSDYIRYARRKFAGTFEVWDVTRPGPQLGAFDTILVNSVFHHLTDVETVHVLRSLATLVNENARIFIIDLVLPGSRGLPRLLANLDRGHYPRHFDHWLRLFGDHLAITYTEAFSVRLLGVRLWDLLLVEARLKASPRP